MSKVGPAGVAWLRLTIGAAIFIAIARPPLRTLRRCDLPVVLGLGVTIGLDALSITIPIAALTAAIVGVPQAAGHLSLGVIATTAGLAILLPVLPYTFELLASCAR
jgi:inner membrane transporter RhtA